MADRGGGQATGRRRQTLLLAALIGWVVVILVAAGRRPEDPPLVGVENLDSVILVGLLLMAFVGLVLLIVLNPFQSKWHKPRRRPKSYGYLVLLIAALILLFWQPQLLEDVLAEREDEEQLGELADEQLEPANEPPPETVAQATDILALVVVVGGIAGAVLLLRRRTQPPHPAVAEDEEFEAELITAMDEAEFELGDSGEPRAAVLNAYRALEVVLESRGNPRAKAETTAEHVTRSLRSMPIDPAPLVQLAELYQLARFSDRTITADQQAAARTALGRARTELTSRA